MGIRQLEEFLGQADQKGFWIFTYANLGGAFFGAFVGNSLLERFAPSLKLLGILLGVLLGAMTTWKVKGHPVYRWILSYAAFVMRRYLKIGFGEHIIDAAQYYRGRTLRQEPFMIVATRDGRPVPVLVRRGSGHGASADLFDGLAAPVPCQSQEAAWGSAGGRSPRSSSGNPGAQPGTGNGSSSSNSHSPDTSVPGERTEAHYKEWDL